MTANAVANYLKKKILLVTVSFMLDKNFKTVSAIYFNAIILFLATI